jgi:branched-subunit amino acid ABC-type transport system permease component
MEAIDLRKALVYAALAVFLGLVLVLAPLITLIATGTEDHYQLPSLFSQRLKELDGSSSEGSKSSTPDVESLALSFVIAFIALMFFRRRRPSGERRSFGPLPYQF